MPFDFFFCMLYHSALGFFHCKRGKRIRIFTRHWKNILCEFSIDICCVWGWRGCYSVIRLKNLWSEVQNHGRAVYIFYMGCVFTSVQIQCDLEVMRLKVLFVYQTHAVCSLCACVLSPSVACSINSYHSVFTSVTLCCLSFSCSDSLCSL